MSITNPPPDVFWLGKKQLPSTPENAGGRD